MAIATSTQKNDIVQKIKEYEQRLQRDPSDHSAEFHLGACLLDIKEFSKAGDVLYKLVQKIRIKPLYMKSHRKP